MWPHQCHKICSASWGKGSDKTWSQLSVKVISWTRVCVVLASTNSVLLSPVSFGFPKQITENSFVGNNDIRRVYKVVIPPPLPRSTVVEGTRTAIPTLHSPRQANRTWLKIQIEHKWNYRNKHSYSSKHNYKTYTITQTNTVMQTKTIKQSYKITQKKLCKQTQLHKKHNYTNKQNIQTQLYKQTHLYKYNYTNTIIQTNTITKQTQLYKLTQFPHFTDSYRKHWAFMKLRDYPLPDRPSGETFCTWRIHSILSPLKPQSSRYLLSPPLKMLN